MIHHIDPLPFSKIKLLGSRYFSNSITITGETGVGTSSTFEALKKHSRFGKLPYRFISGGSIMRAFAAELNMSIEEFASFNRLNPSEGYDRRCDETIQAFGSHNYVVVEGRLPHVFVPPSFHVLLLCPLEERVRRRFKDEQRKRPAVTVEQIKKEIDRRDSDDNNRYEQLYPGCLWPEADFDLKICTSEVMVEQVVEQIIAGHQEWATEHKRAGRLVSSVALTA